MFCPHCKSKISLVDIRSEQCPFCGKKVIIFNIDDVVKHYLHLFQIIAIFSAIALLLPQLTLGLKEIGISNNPDFQTIPLYLSLVVCWLLIMLILILIILKISEYHNHSPVRRFFPSENNNWIAFRRGDIQFYIFIFCFIILYFMMSMYILSTLTLGYIFIAIIIVVFGLIAEIHDYVSHDKDEIEQEKKNNL